jgi:predicted DNA-binding ribbon-helix-helix protein
MAPGLEKRSLVLAGHRTSLALESDFWKALDEAAAARGIVLSRLVEEIDKGRVGGSLASSCRLFALNGALALARVQPGPE